MTELQLMTHVDVLPWFPLATFILATIILIRLYPGQVIEEFLGKFHICHCVLLPTVMALGLWRLLSTSLLHANTSASSLNKDWLPWPVCSPTARAHWTGLQTPVLRLTAHLLYHKRILKRLVGGQLQIDMQFALCFGSTLIARLSCFWLWLILNDAVLL